jgi:hypothetical protein
MKNIDHKLEKQVSKLHQLSIYTRYLFVLLCWFVLVPYALWEMRETISLCQEYCTWAAIRIGLEFNPFASLALIFTIAITTAVLVWQSRNILSGGISPKERYFLEQKVHKIRAMGPKHPLWKWVCK